MENVNNNILPDFDEVVNSAEMNAEAMEMIRQYRIKAAEKYAEKAFLLERDGVGFAPRGNVCAIAAEKKAGKTWFCMAMAAAATHGEFLGMDAREKGLKVLYFDTEQDAGDGQRIQKRVHYVNGWDYESDHDEFQIFHLREVDPKERRRVVTNITTFLKADMVIVDGVRDLLGDFNDLTESAKVIQEHMQLSSALNCCIWDVLHVNPNSDKMRGHLGTELGNKVADIIFLTKKKDPQDEDNVTYKAEETDARGHKDIHSIVFRIDDGKPYGLPVLVGEEEVKRLEQAEWEELRGKMQKAFPDARVFSKTAARDNLKKALSIGSTKADRLIEQGVEQGLVEMVSTPHGVKYKIISNPDAPRPIMEDLPFPPPD